MRASLLIIAEEPKARLLRDSLHAAELVVTVTATAEEALAALASASFDLVVLDLETPDGDGFTLLKRIRRLTDAPLLTVSESDADEDAILGLGLGADQFVARPFVPRVLMARVRALLRRVGEPCEAPGSIRFEDFVLDIEGRLLRRGKERIPLSAKEYAVLAYLARRPGVAVTPDTIYADVWDNADGDITAVAVYIQRLRRKIEREPGNPTILQTVHGSGYRFSARILPAEDAASAGPRAAAR
jgi:DNA-binding response OmpR family regulator